MSLDKYMANNTTEDDASFAELVEENEKKQRIKLAPFFPSLQCSAPAPLDNPKTLALPGVSNAVVGPRVTITGNNAVHFNPDGVSQTKEELLEFLSKERKIVSSNTRFKRPFPVNLEKKRTMKHLLATKLGRFGLNGLETNTPYGTPQASGYKFIDSSPSPMTMFPHTPLMTWGELDSTPYRLDDGETTPSVVSGAPAFRIPSPSQREQLAHQLADKASRQRVRDRLEAVKRMQSAASSPSRSLLSPAALRLLASSSSIINNELNSRPSTGTSCIGDQTSSPHPKVNTPRRVPSDLGVVRRTNSARLTPHRESVKADVDQKKVSLERGGNLGGKTESSSSITDNLLNLKFQNS
ncbi:Protein DGCR14 isoform 2 [Schistosoma japonicum]|nr:Splicing factor ESS-2 like [Schistosoma japonicum]TNN06681.1 Protein DGCR14 isoform 2 [Schistosoma japonicum]TNN06683.1 Protein DGCR14 isoform 2 [Schistosoma japonicum]TNN06684.1 Protein DGCR14 isoform 2 [Schistosoma japonicum]